MKSIKANKKNVFTRMRRWFLTFDWEDPPTSRAYYVFNTVCMWICIGACFGLMMLGAFKIADWLLK